jgi:hypothetical protein
VPPRSSPEAWGHYSLMRMLLEEAALIFYSVCARRGRNHTPEPIEALRQE